MPPESTPEPNVFSVVPAGHDHRVVGERVVIHPGLNLEILTTRKIVLSEWTLRGLNDPYWRLYLPIEGKAIVEIESEITELTPGHLYLISPHTTINAHISAPFTKWYVHFTLGRTGDRAAPGIYSQKITAPFDAIEKSIAASNDAPFPWNSAALVIDSLRELPPDIWSARRLDNRVEVAMDFMYSNFRRKLTTDDIARASAMSVRNLNHLFKSQVALAPMRVLLDFRLDQACRRLRHTDESIEQIAEDCGFPNRYYFSRMLKQHRAISPAAYRKVGLLPQHAG
jgi:AraC-like DNA-binding protein